MDLQELKRVHLESASDKPAEYYASRAAKNDLRFKGVEGTLKLILDTVRKTNENDLEHIRRDLKDLYNLSASILKMQEEIKLNRGNFDS